MMQNNQNLVWHSHLITRELREKLHGHKGVALWFTGLSGSGKSTIADAVEKELYQMGISSYLLDGDNIRNGLCKDLNFTHNDRKENIRRIGEVVKLMVDAGLIVLIALISPYRIERQKIRKILPRDCFLEIFVDTPLSTCESRDPKGLYKQARNGKINNFTGIHSEYQPPLQPDLRLNGSYEISHLTEQVLKLLHLRKLLVSKNINSI
ncbi:adenylyl-sulfate kinase [Candidatus Erwinia haradaeae]|uniref:Adenylyl-sulfate kinase n=1 Tax=Candidatus Erwinia haradaeae TaxID=1922217 RepID=A0A451D3L0_9GAMM|nr:adenylyl-sulfate kinase [Candidatus Erwinia haradaeae]VFP80238.1 Adenylyl-sulfate kinase [Candidatus Erwinia haradaeae]